MGIPPLPMPPPPPQAAPGPRGGVVMPPGYAPPKSSIPVQLLQGVSQFIQQFHQQNDAKQEHWRAKVFDAIQQNQQAGMELIPNEKIMKWANLAGMDWKTEPPTDAEKAYKAQQQAAAAVPPGSPGMPAGIQAPQGPPPSAPPPSLMDRIRKNYLGGNVSRDSPANMFLTQLQQAGQGAGTSAAAQITRGGWLQKLTDKLTEHGADVQHLDLNQQMLMLKNVNSIFNNEPGSDEMLHHMSQMGKMNELPSDSLALLFHRMNPAMPPEQVRARVAEMQMYMTFNPTSLRLEAAKIGKELNPTNPQAGAEYFLNTVRGVANPAGGQIGITPEMFEKMQNGIKNSFAGNETVPFNIRQAYGLVSMLPGASAADPRTGGKSFQQQFADFIGQHYAPDKSFDQKQTLAQFGLDRESKLGELQVNRGELDVKKLRAIVDAAGDEGKTQWSIINNKDSSEDAKIAAYRQLAAISGRLKNVQVNYGGQNIPITDPQSVVNGWMDKWRWPSTTPFMQPQQSAVPNFFLGAPQQPQVAQTPPGMSGDQYMGQLRNRAFGAFNGLSEPEVRALAAKSGMDEPHIQGVLQSLQTQKSQQQQIPVPQDDQPQE